MQGYNDGPGAKAFRIFNALFMILLAMVTLYPMLYMLILSFNEGMDSMKGGIWLFPRKPTLFNFQFVLNNPLMRSAYVITIGRTLAGTLVSMTVTGLCAYGFSFRELPYRRFLMLLVIIPMVFNGGLIPYYLQLRNLRLLNSFWVFVIPGAFVVFNMFVMRKSFMDIPESLKESAHIDGASHLQILTKVVLPLSKPMLAAIGLFTAVGHWNDWFSGAFFVDNLKLIPIQTYLQRILSADSLSMLSGNNAIMQEAAARQGQMNQMTVTSVKMAAVMCGTLPILMVYPFLQKYFVKGMLTGSIKG